MSDLQRQLPWGYCLRGFTGTDAVVPHLVQKSLIDRFPHLRHDIHVLAESDPVFQQLVDDYVLLTRSIQNIEAEAGAELEEMMSLKTSLEVEALEILSRANCRQ